jgi:hypothetical protein
MYDQLQKDCRSTEYLPDALMAKTPTQIDLQTDGREELLKQHQSGEGGQGLVLEPQFRDSMSFTANGRPAMLHGDGPLWFAFFVFDA